MLSKHLINIVISLFFRLIKQQCGLRVCFKESSLIMKAYFKTVHDITKIDIGEIDIYFSLGDIVVESKYNEKHGTKEIEIRGILDFNPIYSNLDLRRLIRPELLIIQGVISLFIDFPITVYDITS